jgi:hypothetical protein
MFFDQTLHSLELRGSEAVTVCQSDWIEPKLGLKLLPLDVHVNWFRMVGRVKVKPVWSKSKNRRQRP